MDPLAFLTWQFVMFSLFVYAIMWVLRITVEFFIPSAKTAKVWVSFLLLILPIFLGGFLGWIFKAYPYSTGFVSTGGHVAYGSVAGLLSTILFKVIKELLGNKIASAVQGVVGAVSGTNTTNPVVGTPDAPVAPEADDQSAIDSARSSINKQ